MIFINAIKHEINQFSKINSRMPKYLILSNDKFMLLNHECFHSSDEKVQKMYDPHTGRKSNQFIGLELVQLSVSFQGSMSWGLGE